jgi:hypothetical protein
MLESGRLRGNGAAVTGAGGAIIVIGLLMSSWAATLWYVLLTLPGAQSQTGFFEAVLITVMAAAIIYVGSQVRK